MVNLSASNAWWVMRELKLVYALGKGSTCMSIRLVEL